ncbi:uncharacterized protein N7458_002546 [Penicillium daleae]|uniref:Uncharacterized protein n=1 Tax=Penicillium daleae TaxID=63821 RepID=A0AAD6CD60_9EURO|nr:uncharacterized protein N7458_002546 [Penicillium daleae]KAJ5460994.1 hypothetical protein N7458_002546 [Penicillium daleae]
MDASTQPSVDECEREGMLQPGQPGPGEVEIPKVLQTSSSHVRDVDAEEEKRKLAVEPFRAVLEALAQMEHDDPKAAAQGARLLSLFRRLWESSVSKQIDSQRLEVGNQQLRAMSSQLQLEGNQLKNTHDDQLYHFHALEQKLMDARRGMFRLLNEWSSTSSGGLNVSPEDSQGGNNDTERLP